jgi:hypothetical protein
VATCFGSMISRIVEQELTISPNSCHILSTWTHPEGVSRLRSVLLLQKEPDDSFLAPAVHLSILKSALETERIKRENVDETTLSASRF